MDPLFITLVIVGSVVLLGGILWSFNIGKQQQDNRKNEGNKTVAKHPVLLNPIFISYILVVVAVAIGSFLFYFYLLKSGGR